MTSVVGTLITDRLVDELGVSLVTVTLIFSVVLAAIFGFWYASEKTLITSLIIWGASHFLFSDRKLIR